MNIMKKRCREIGDSDDYQAERDIAFNEEFRDNFSDNTGNLYVITEDDVRSFLDSFDFPDPAKWACDKAEQERDEWADRKYEQYKDERRT